ncbi:MAG TPA: lipid II flippase MurJ, partial [Roseovarius nubinhibens]|nr:lipid II flippase MurJ [Roseovarius nubinhibens]
ALAVAIYGLGLPAFVLQKVVQPVFFAREDTRSPFRYAIVAMVVNAVIAVGLAPVIGWFAAALATTVAAWAMLLLLVLGARKFGETTRFDARFRARAWRIALASALMGLVLAGLMLLLGPLFGMPGLRWLALLALIGLGGLSYFAFGTLTRAFSLAELKSRLRRSA